MIISIIVAMDEQGVIGRDNDLPWRLSDDLKHVKTITMGKPIIMGRKTHESIGKPLPGRENIVISRNENYSSEGCVVFNSIDDALESCREHNEVMLMGGEEIFRQTLDKVSRIYLTEVHANIEGDTYFPEYNDEDWHEISREDFKADEKNEYDYSFVILERVAQ